MTPAKLSCKQLLLPAAILALSLMLAISILLIHPAMAQTTHNVKIIPDSFNPKKLCIECCDIVVWNNTDSLIHTLWFVFAENTSTYLLSDPIIPGGSWSHNFTDFAKFKLLYYSFEHLWYTGTIKIWKIFGDIDGDGDVDKYDLGYFASAYGSREGTPKYNEWADFDCDGDVDKYDLGIFAENYAKVAVPC